MAASINLSLLVVVLGQAAVTLVAAGPTPTPPEAHAGGVKFGFTPRPTQPPGLGLLGTALQLQHAVLSPLVKRQASDAAICGYESGIESSSLRCTSGQSCLYTTTSGVGGALACCYNKADCTFITACRELLDPCDAACFLDPRIRKCYLPGQNYCNSYTISGLGISGLACGATPTRRWVEMEPTYRGQPAATTPASGGGGGGSLPSASLPRPAGPTATTTATDSVSNAPPVTGAASSPPSVPVGTIVGAVVGGLSAIGAAVVAIAVVIRLRKRGRESRDSAHAAIMAARFQQQQQQQQPPPPVMSQQPHQQQRPSYFAAVPGTAMFPPMQQLPPLTDGKLAGIGGGGSGGGGGGGGGGGPVSPLAHHQSVAPLPPYHPGSYELHAHQTGSAAGSAPQQPPHKPLHSPAPTELPPSAMAALQPAAALYEAPDQPEGR